MLIRRALFTETGTYNDDFNRPFVPQVTSDTRDRLQRQTEMGNNLSISAVASAAAEIMRPQSMVESAVNVVNGWDNRKFRFMLEIEHPTIGGSRVVDLISGYTDYTGISQQTNNMDPGLRLYINSVTGITEYTRIGQDGRQYRDVHVRESNQVMSGYFNPAARINQYFLAPQDLFDGIGLNNALGGLADSRDLATIDSRGTALDAPRLSNRSNNHGGSYLSRVLGAYSGSLRSASMSEDNMSTVMKSAKSSVADRHICEVQSLDQLMQRTDLQHNQCVTWGELLAIQPNLENLTHVAFNRGNVVMDRLAERGNTENWDSITNETIAATIIRNTIPALMNDCKLTKVAFTATNDLANNFNGQQYSVVMADANSFAKILEIDSPVMQKNLNAFTHRVATELMPGLSHNNMMLCTVNVRCDLWGDTYIDVSLNGGPMIPFSNAQWADSLSAPIVTIDAKNRTTMARDMGALLDTLTRN